jgi:proteasome lid subunit RPN8/RPN11
MASHPGGPTSGQCRQHLAVLNRQPGSAGVEEPSSITADDFADFERRQLTIATDDADEAFWAIVHSHTHTPAVPSPTDIGLAFYPESLYILVSLDDEETDPETGEPSLRAWRIVDGEVAEVELQ